MKFITFTTKNSKHDITLEVSNIILIEYNDETTWRVCFVHSEDNYEITQETYLRLKEELITLEGGK